MKQFYIPKLGAEVVLAADWTITVYNDHRNALLVKWSGNLMYNPTGFNPIGIMAPGDYDWWSHAKRSISVTIPKGTRLVIDRIYIRKGQDEFDSLTFYAPDIKVEYQMQKKRMRFFAKLDEVNQMMVEA